MKILFVLTYYRPHWTGLTQYAARLAEALAARGNRVSVLCSQHDRQLPLKEELAGVQVTRLPYLFRFLRSVIMPGFPWELWRQIKENQVVVVYLPLQEVVLVALLTKILGKRLYLVHNGDLVLPESGGWLARLVEKIYFFSTALAIGLSRAVIIQSVDYAQNSPLLSAFRKKWRVVLPLYEVPKVSAKEVVDFKKKHRLEKKILIGFSGRWVEEKGVDFLLQAIPLVKKDYPDAHFVFAGEAKISYENFFDRIKPLLQKNRQSLTLLGLLKNQKEVFVFYRALDLLVQPSRTDCFPSSQIEALLSGVPSVCTDIPGARWVIKETGMGLLAKPQDPKSLAENIVKALKQREVLRRRWPIVKSLFDYQKTVSAYVKLFGEE